MRGLESLERRLDAIVAALTRAAQEQRKVDAPAIVAAELRAIGIEVRPGPHTGGVVVVEHHEDDPPDYDARIQARLGELGADLTEGITFVHIDLCSAAKRGEAAAREPWRPPHARQAEANGSTARAPLGPAEPKYTRGDEP